MSRIERYFQLAIASGRKFAIFNAFIPLSIQIRQRFNSSILPQPGGLIPF